MTQAGPAEIESHGAAAPPTRAWPSESGGARGWTAPKLLAAIALTAAGMIATGDAWLDMISIAWNDEEASHIFLVPLVILWLLWSRQEELDRIPVRPSLLGPAIIVLGGLLNWYGFDHLNQSLFHGGAVLVAVGCFVTVAGHQVLLRLWPVFLVLAFLVPVPGLIRQQIALPLQTATAAITQSIYDAFAVDVVRNGNVLRFNGVDIAVAEACNGMRMVFALVLVTYAVAFASPLKSWVRVMLLLLTPIFAIACNVARLLPTVWLYGYYPDTVGPVFHDLSGWAMIAVAWGLVTGLIALLQWLDIPVNEAESPRSSEPTVSGAGHAVRPARAAVAVIVALAALGGVGGVLLARPTARDAEPYHARVRDAAAALPRDFGAWNGHDTPVPQAAQKLLRPNAILSRVYTNVETGRSATLVVVHCKDARDMIGHYPPACYPNSGWTQTSASPRTWTVDGMQLSGIQYEFTFHHPTGVESMVVDNLLVLPSGEFARDMEQVMDAAADYRRRFFGAAQIQVLTSSTYTEAQREEMFQEVVAVALPLIQAIGSADAPASEAATTARPSPTSVSNEPDPIPQT